MKRDVGVITPHRHRHADPVRAVASPRVSGVFGPVSGVSPLHRAVQAARHRTDKAQRRAEKNVVLPRIPAHVAPKNRGYAAGLVARAAHAQGIHTGQEARNLPAAQRAIITRAAHGFNANQRNVERSVAARALRTDPLGFARLSPTDLARVGRAIIQAHEGQAKPGHYAPPKGPSGPVQVAEMPLAAGLNFLVGKVKHGLSTGEGVALSRFVGHDAPHFAGNIGADALNFPKSAVLGLYGIGHAGGELAQGRPGEAKRLLTGLTHGAAGDLLRGDVQGALHQFGTHPLYAAMDFTGLEGAVGRTAGTVARITGRAGELVGAEGNALARAGATAREPLRLGDTGQIVERRYSPDLLRKGLQVLADRHRARGGADPNVATGSRLHRELLKAGDETAAQAEGMRRPGRAVRQNASRSLERQTPRAARDLVQAAAEGELRHPAVLEADLRAMHKRLQAAWDTERSSMTADMKRNNREQRKTIETVLADPKKLEKTRASIFPVADAYRAHADQVEAELVRTGALDPEQAKAAKLRRYAVAHMGARYDHRKTAPEEMVARHEQARTVEERAKANLDSVRGRLEAANARRSRLVGKNSSQRASDRARGGEPRTMLRREADRAGSVDAATRNVKALRAEKRQAEAAWKKARRDRVASDPKKYTTGLVDGQGNRITTRQIEEHIAADPHARMPAFVSHRPGVGGTSAHFVNWLSSRKGAGAAKTRTGEAARVGGQDPSFRALEDSLVRGQGVADAAKNFDRYVGDLGVKHPSGRHFTWDEAVKYADHLAHDVHGDPKPNAVKMVPVRVLPAKYDRARADRIMEGQATPAIVDEGGLTQQRLEQSLKAPAAGVRAKKQNVVLIPEVQVQRLLEHQRGSSGDIAKLSQAVTGAFRSTVLPFSTKWVTGNTVEAALRLAVNDTPLGLVASAHAGRRVIRELQRLDAEASKAFDARATGGLLYDGQRTVYGGAERFAGGKFEKPAQVASAIHQLPMVKQITGGIGQFQRAVFALNSKLEHASQVVAVGKEARREMQAMTGSWSKALRAQKAAVEDVARGLVNTPAQVRYARAVDETLGKYNRFSPELRRVTQTVAPFLPWYLNSLRFVYHTLPVRHPVKTALLASVEQTLSKDFEQEHRGVPPGSLQGAIPMRDGGWLDLSRFTPFGAFSEGAKAITDPILPQVSSVFNILAYGNSWTGNKLRLHDGSTVQGGSGKAVGMALYAALESLFPGVSIARRLQEHGTAYDDSTVFHPRTKPNTGHGRSPANRIFNPVGETYLHSGGVQTVRSGGGGHSILDAVNAQRGVVPSSPAADPSALLDAINRHRSGR